MKVVEKELRTEGEYEAFLLQKKMYQVHGYLKLEPWINFGETQARLVLLLAFIYTTNLWPGSCPRNENANPKLFWSVSAAFLIVMCCPFTMFLFGKEHTPMVPVNGNKIQSGATSITSANEITLWNFWKILLVDPISETTAVELVLNRYQTDEWKGWMQIFFLLYHYYRAGYVYNEIRICVSAYVWLTGFGNWCYFMKKRDFSLKRLTLTLFRINFFPVVCSLACNVPFALYYVVPLHTFWLGVTYVVARSADFLRQRYESKREWMTFGVILAAFALVALLFEIIVPYILFPGSSSLWKSLERRNEDLTRLQKGLAQTEKSHEWQMIARYFQQQFLVTFKDFVFTFKECCFRFQLDRYSGLWGIVAAEYMVPMFRGYVRLTHNFVYGKMRSKEAATTSSTTVFESVHTFTKLICCDLIQLGVGLGFFFSWWTFFGKNRDKFEYNACHSLHLFLPMSGYLVLRNMMIFKRFFSRGFAFVGGMTLETYIIQFHCLMCRNVSHILVLFPGAEQKGSMLYYLNTIFVMFFVFLGTSWWARKLTNETLAFVEWYFFKRFEKNNVVEQRNFPVATDEGKKNK